MGRGRSSVDLLCTHSEVNILVLQAMIASASVDEDGHCRAWITGRAPFLDETVNRAVSTDTELVVRHVQRF